MQGQRSIDNESFELPPTLQVRSADRGIIADIAVKFLKVFAKKEISEGVAKLAMRLEDEHLRNGISKDSTVWANDF